jgi:hypothetical protein
MTAHKHAAMIKSKADNMDLVVFSKNESGWRVSTFEDIVCWPSHEHFLCLPQHKEACLHWLNGGEVECKSNIVGEEWKECYPLGSWHSGLGLMREDAKYRIKPRKEKCWIGYCANTNQTFPHPQKTIEIAEDYAARSYGYKMSDWQFIEIEVEV